MSALTHESELSMTQKTHPDSSLNTLKLTDNSLAVLKARYLSKNEKGEISETPEALILRVAAAVASAEKAYGADASGAVSYTHLTLPTKRIV